MKGTSEKAAKIRSDLWLRLDRMTVHLQLGRWAGDALTPRSEAGFKLGKDTHLRSRLLHLDVRQSQQSDYND
jgi:hypothetical protein